MAEVLRGLLDDDPDRPDPELQVVTRPLIHPHSPAKASERDDSVLEDTVTVSIPIGSYSLISVGGEAGFEALKDSKPSF